MGVRLIPVSCFELEHDFTFLTDNSEFITVKNKTFLPENRAKKVYPSILGLDVLKHFDLEFNPPQGELLLKPARETPFTVSKNDNERF